MSYRKAPLRRLLTQVQKLLRAEPRYDLRSPSLHLSSCRASSAPCEVCCSRIQELCCWPKPHRLRPHSCRLFQQAKTISRTRLWGLLLGPVAAAALLGCEAAAAEARKLDTGNHCSPHIRLDVQGVSFALGDFRSSWPLCLTCTAVAGAETLEELARDLRGSQAADRERAVASLSTLTLYLEHHDQLLEADILPALFATIRDSRSIPQVCSPHCLLAVCLHLTVERNTALSDPVCSQCSHGCCC